MELPLRTTPPDVLIAPPQSCGIEALPRTELRARGASHQEDRLLLHHEVPRLLAHLVPREIPRVAIFVLGRQIQSEARQQSQARQQLQGAGDPRHAVDLSHKALEPFGSFPPVRVRVASEPSDQLENLPVPIHHLLADSIVLSHCL